MHVVFGSCIEVGLLHFLWQVKFVARFQKYRRNCAIDQGKCGHLRRDRRVHKGLLLVHVMYPVAVVCGKRYPQYTISWVTWAGKVISDNCALPSKGKSIPYFADDRYGNSCLYNPTLLKPCRFLTALRLRSETTSDRVCLNKVIPQATTKCRKYKTCIETLQQDLLKVKFYMIKTHAPCTDMYCSNNFLWAIGGSCWMALVARSLRVIKFPRTVVLKLRIKCITSLFVKFVMIPWNEKVTFQMHPCNHK